MNLSNFVASKGLVINSENRKLFNDNIQELGEGLKEFTVALVNKIINESGAGQEGNNQNWKPYNFNNLIYGFGKSQAIYTIDCLTLMKKKFPIQI